MWPSEAREKVLERDKGVCALCGIDCLLVERRMQEILDVLQWGDGAKDDLHAKAWAFVYRIPSEEALRNPLVREYVELAESVGVKPSSRRASVWQADHIVPVIEGGGECGLENYRTLCVGCHHRETAALARRRAEARKAAPRTNSRQ